MLLMLLLYLLFIHFSHCPSLLCVSPLTFPLSPCHQVPHVRYALQHNIGLGGAAVVAVYRLGFPDKLKPFPADKPNPAVRNDTLAPNATSSSASPAPPAAAPAAKAAAAAAAPAAAAKPAAAKVCILFLFS